MSTYYYGVSTVPAPPTTTEGQNRFWSEGRRPNPVAVVKLYKRLGGSREQSLGVSKICFLRRFKSGHIPILFVCVLWLLRDCGGLNSRLDCKTKKGPAAVRSGAKSRDILPARLGAFERGRFGGAFRDQGRTVCAACPGEFNRHLFRGFHDRGDEFCFACHGTASVGRRVVSLLRTI